MSLIEQDVERLLPASESWSLLDGLLLGAVIGATGAALVVIGQVMATRRLRRRVGPAGASARMFQPDAKSSPL